jgi:hypothetical protein
MCYDAKVANKRARRHSSGSNGRRKVFRATYRNLCIQDILEELESMD